MGTANELLYYSGPLKRFGNLSVALVIIDIIRGNIMSTFIG
jgi:hypothetical protein